MATEELSPELRAAYDRHRSRKATINDLLAMATSEAHRTMRSLPPHCLPHNPDHANACAHRCWSFLGELARHLAVSTAPLGASRSLGTRTPAASAPPWRCSGGSSSSTGIALTPTHRAFIADHGPYKLRKNGVIEDRNGVSMTNCRPTDAAKECEWDRALVAALNEIAGAAQ